MSCLGVVGVLGAQVSVGVPWGGVVADPGVTVCGV